MNNSDPPKRILLVGCGKMGSALLSGWTSSDMSFECTVIDPASTNAALSSDTATVADASTSVPHHKNTQDTPPSNLRYVKSYRECTDFIGEADVIVLAVKPQFMAKICADLKPHAPKTTLILSIAAGQTISNFEDHFDADQPIVRSMPNTPAAIGKGITVAVPNPHVSPEQKDLADALLGAAGLIEWVEDENLLNAVTALSGSGPAYVFYLIETLTKAGEEIGLPAELAGKLARQTVIGSAALAEHETELSASDLRTNVTSPGGTTEAALEVLMNGEFEALFKRALDAARQRSENHT